MPDGKLKQAVEAYFTDLRLVRNSGGATDERSLYVPLANLLNAVDCALRPKGFCVRELADHGAGHPDFGFYSTRQVQRGKPKPGQKPERGVVEVSTATVVRFADALDSRIYVMNLERTTAGINKAETPKGWMLQSGSPMRCGESFRRRCPAISNFLAGFPKRLG